MKMNLLIVGVIGLLSQVAIADGMTSFPNGNFSGEGNWSGVDGQSGTYKVSTQIQDNDVVASYEFKGRKETLAFHAIFDKAGSFVIKSDNDLVGKGYCMSTQCHYEIQNSKFTMEETITFFQGHLYKLGSKVLNGQEVHWEEALVSSSSTQ